MGIVGYDAKDVLKEPRPLFSDLLSKKLSSKSKILHLENLPAKF